MITIEINQEDIENYFNKLENEDTKSLLATPSDFLHFLPSSCNSSRPIHHILGINRLCQSILKIKS